MVVFVGGTIWKILPIVQTKIITKTLTTTTTVYGLSPESRVTDADDPLKIFSWLICESYDDKGNAIIYRYKQEDSSNLDLSQIQENNRSEHSRSTQRYLKRILYGNQSPYQQGEELNLRNDWMFEAVLDYGEEHYQQQNEDEQGQRFINIRATEQIEWVVWICYWNKA